MSDSTNPNNTSEAKSNFSKAEMATPLLSKRPMLLVFLMLLYKHIDY